MMTPCRCKCPIIDPPPDPEHGYVDTGNGCGRGKCLDGLLPYQWTVDWTWDPPIYPKRQSECLEASGPFVGDWGSFYTEHYKQKAWTLVWDNNYYGACVWRSIERAWSFKMVPDSARWNRPPSYAYEIIYLSICNLTMGSKRIDDVVYTTFSFGITAGTGFNPGGGIPPMSFAYYGQLPWIYDDRGRRVYPDCNQQVTLNLISPKVQTDNFSYYCVEASPGGDMNYGCLPRAPFIREFTPPPASITIAPS